MVLFDAGSLSKKEDIAIKLSTDLKSNIVVSRKAYVDQYQYPAGT